MKILTRKTILFNEAPRLIAIMGGSGAGKSHLVGLLQKSLGKDMARLSLDDFYRDRSHVSLSHRARVNFDHPRAIDWKALEKVLDQLRQGRPAQSPQYDFATHSRLPEMKWIKPRGLILVEGLWPCHRATVRRMFDYRIFLACPAGTRLRRRLHRDVRERGRSPESVRAQFFQAVAPMHKKFIAPQTRWADLIVRRPMRAREVAQLAKLIGNIRKS